MTADTISPVDGFLAKLNRRVTLSAPVRAEFEALQGSIIRAKAGQTIQRENDESHRCLFVMSGFISRKKSVGNSSQIVGIGIEGDAIDLQSLWFRRSDHTVFAQSDCTLFAVEHRLVVERCRRDPSLMALLWHDSLVDAAIFREWNLNIGHRRAQARLGHFFLEISSRMQANGLVGGDIFELPMTQTDVGSALGLSLVHTNKSLRGLKECKLIDVRGRIIKIVDRPRLIKETGFDPAYLHIDSPPIER